ncbi:acyl-CoA thioesterase [uncultured Nitratireductor sp.]|uniref:acyl-CoA thioesterase n=1 Tax=uncultured Nitratireductor sp. TaxID=520953 RepID=UPI0025F59DD8|nr:acyl-CoA thioesterase [uncultured Nitratireductor sp.]
MPHHHRRHRALFGDCDPAGIVYYPRFFAWFDQTFHDWLHAYGGHRALCARLQAIGIGLTNADASFRSPAREGDLLETTLTISEWNARHLLLDYEVRCGDRLVASGSERRRLFQHDDNRIVAGDMLRLRKLIDVG